VCALWCHYLFEGLRKTLHICQPDPGPSLNRRLLAPPAPQVCTPVPVRVARHTHSGAMLNYIMVKSIVFPARGRS
jgi:hypothetical protein